METYRMSPAIPQQMYPLSFFFRPGKTTKLKKNPPIKAPNPLKFNPKASKTIIQNINKESISQRFL